MARYIVGYQSENYLFMSVIYYRLVPFLLLLCISSACKKSADSPSDPLTTGNRTELPLKVIYSKQSVTPVISVKINGVDNDLLFDTGSSGIRILGGALKGANVNVDAKQVTYRLGDSKSNTLIKGRQASGTVSVGELSSAGPLQLMLIDTITHSWTSRVTSTVDSVVVKGEFRNLAGLFGVDMRYASGSTVASPLAQLSGNHSYLVRFPQFGQPVGQLVVNPTASDLTGFTFFSLTPGATPLPNGLNSWVTDQLNGMMIIDGRLIQAHTILDTGNPASMAFAPNLTGQGILAPGTVLKLGIGLPGRTTTLIDTTFRVTEQVAGRDLVYTNESTQANAFLSFGTDFFFAFDVYYDQEGGRIGFRKK